MIVADYPKLVVFFLCQVRTQRFGRSLLLGPIQGK